MIDMIVFIFALVGFIYIIFTGIALSLAWIERKSRLKNKRFKSSVYKLIKEYEEEKLRNN